MAFLVRLGPMRVALVLAALTVAVLIPWPEAGVLEPKYGDFRGVVVPALAPILFMLLMLDVLMSAVHRADSDDEAVRARYRMIIRTHLVTATLMVLATLPFFATLLSA